MVIETTHVNARERLRLPCDAFITGLSLRRRWRQAWLLGLGSGLSLLFTLYGQAPVWIGRGAGLSCPHNHASILVGRRAFTKGLSNASARARISGRRRVFCQQREGCGQTADEDWEDDEMQFCGEVPGGHFQTRLWPSIFASVHQLCRQRVKNRLAAQKCLARRM